MVLFKTLKDESSGANIAKVALRIDSENDDGLERNINVNTLSSNAKRITRHIYDWQDVARKYNLKENFFKDKYTKEKGAILQAIVEYEATRSKAVEETLFYKDLSDELSKNVKIDNVVEEIKKDQRNKNFLQIYEETVKRIKSEKSENKAAEKLFNIMKDSERKGLEITDAIDKRIMDNIQTANQEKSQYLANMSLLTHKIQSSGNTC